MIGAVALVLLAAAFYYLPWLLRGIANFMYQYPYMRKLPGPKGIPFIGSILELHGDSTVPLKFWAREAEKARLRGDGIFTTTTFGRNITFPINGDMVKLICESNEELMKGKDYEFLRPWLGNGIVFAVGQEWKDRRKSYTPLFHNRAMLEGYLDTFNKHSRIMTEILAENVGKTVDMSLMLKRCALDNICDSSLGFDFGIQRHPEHPYTKSVDTFTHYEQRYINEPQMWSTLVWYLFYHREYKEALDIMNALTKEVLDNRMRRVKAGEVDLEAEKRPLIDHFISQYEKGEWTLEEVHLELNSAIFGGHDSTSTTLAWAFWSLATQPHFQQKCYEEIREIFGDDSDRECTHEDMNQMKFTERFIKESMRMFTPIPVVERELQVDFQMGEYLLPKGSEIFIAGHLVHHNPDIWPEPSKFDPDRFLPEHVLKRSPYDYVPFSAGARNCLGQKFALHEIKTIISWALRRFSFHTHHQLLDQECSIEVVNKPTLGVHLRVEKRVK